MHHCIGLLGIGGGNVLCMHVLQEREMEIEGELCILGKEKKFGNKKNLLCIKR